MILKIGQYLVKVKEYHRQTKDVDSKTGIILVIEMVPKRGLEPRWRTLH
ncbi:MAG: hypothetical protein KKF00_01425 [Proteobacteria bacterium]|nr:hypothetical protein [Pseudomonadota bacterium]